MSERLKLTVTSPVQTFTEPLSVAEVKEFLEIPDADTTRDSMLSAMIEAAREVAELEQGRDLVAKQWDLTIDHLPDEIYLRENATSVDLFTYRDSSGTVTTMVENTDFLFDTSEFEIVPPYGQIFPTFTPWPAAAVLVRYTVTPPAIDKQVLLGMRFLISQWYTNRIPAELGASAVQQYPYALALLRHGRVERA
jgi:uncharacterized phiE125 gp8 family phage protein